MCQIRCECHLVCSVHICNWDRPRFNSVARDNLACLVRRMRHFNRRRYFIFPVSLSGWFQSVGAVQLTSNVETLKRRFAALTA